MNIEVAFPSKWIRAANLQGRDITLTILRCFEEQVGRGSETLPVLYFSGTEKGLVLNKTNANTIADALGAETDNWIGQKITLYSTTTDFEGKRTDCIRIRDLAPVQQPAPPVLDKQPISVPPDDSAIPF